MANVVQQFAVSMSLCATHFVDRKDSQMSFELQHSFQFIKANCLINVFQFRVFVFISHSLNVIVRMIFSIQKQNTIWMWMCVCVCFCIVTFDMLLLFMCFVYALAQNFIHAEKCQNTQHK